MLQNKKWGALLGVILLAVTCMPMKVFGQENTVGDDIRPMTTVTGESDAKLKITDRTAKITANIRGLSYISSVCIKIELQRYTNGEWTVYASWSEEKAGYRMAVEKSVSVEEGTYRLVTTFTAYFDDTSESTVQEGQAVICK